MPALGFCQLTLVASKPLPPEYPRELRSLGDHLRTERLRRELEQKHVAAMLGVNVNTIVGWEVGRKQPKRSYVPAIIAFLGYDPLPTGENLGERLRRERERRGLTQKRCARHLGIGTSTLQKLEAGEKTRDERVHEAVREFLGPEKGV